MGAETTGQAGAEESQTQQGAGHQAATRPSGADGQEAVPGKRRGQALCAALRHGLLSETHSVRWQEAPPLSSGGHGAREWEPGATHHTLHTTARVHAATLAGDTQTTA